MDTANFTKSDEINIAVAHNPALTRLGCFPSLFLVEVKNWKAPVDSPSIAVSINKLRDRRVELGILVAASGVTGDLVACPAAYQKASSAQASGIRLVLVTFEDILRLKAPDQFTTLLVKRMLDLVASDTFQFDPGLADIRRG